MGPLLAAVLLLGVSLTLQQTVLVWSRSRIRAPRAFSPNLSEVQFCCYCLVLTDFVSKDTLLQPLSSKKCLSLLISKECLLFYVYSYSIRFVPVNQKIQVRRLLPLSCFQIKVKTQSPISWKHSRHCLSCVCSSLAAAAHQCNVPQFSCPQCELCLDVSPHSQGPVGS